MFDLPAHLSNLNAIASPPSAAINAESEDAFWDFMHADQLFENFGGVSPAAHDAKEESLLHQQQIQSISTPAPISAPAPTPAPTLAGFVASPATAIASTPSSATPTGPTLEAFLAAFANEHASTSGSSSTGYRLPLTLPIPYSSAPTPAASGTVDTAALLGQSASDDSESSDRASGAKRLKQIGAPPAEIEEDKRRRNTEASARFRAKKKEREQALEGRAKELEAQVAQLVADKSSLENENRLLKAIVLGSGQGGAEQLQGALAALGAKRKREN